MIQYLVPSEETEKRLPSLWYRGVHVRRITPVTKERTFRGKPWCHCHRRRLILCRVDSATLPPQIDFHCNNNTKVPGAISVLADGSVKNVKIAKC